MKLNYCFLYHNNILQVHNFLVYYYKNTNNNIYTLEGMMNIIAHFHKYLIHNMYHNNHGII